LCFFFSSRRRHTRFSRDWSSDVCSFRSMQLLLHCTLRFFALSMKSFFSWFVCHSLLHTTTTITLLCIAYRLLLLLLFFFAKFTRSEERRVVYGCLVTLEASVVRNTDIRE